MGGKLFFGIAGAISACCFCWSLYSFFSAPVVQLLVDREIEDVRRRIDLELLASASTDVLTARIRETLAVGPVDWVGIDLLREFAAEHEVVLPDDLLAHIHEMEAKERHVTGVLSCFECVLYGSGCVTMSVRTCEMAVELSPVGDAHSIYRAVSDWADGRPIDTFDVGLSVVGIGAAAASGVTGGSAYGFKIGSGVLKLARKSGNMSNKLLHTIRSSADGLVDLAKIPSDWHKRPAILIRAVDMKKYRSLKLLISEVGGIIKGAGVGSTVRLLKYVDSAEDAHRARIAVEAMEHRAPKAFQVLGKSKVFKHTYRLNATIIEMVGSFLGLVASLIGFFLKSIVGLFGWFSVFRASLAKSAPV